jgi:hypothetical protein
VLGALPVVAEFCRRLDIAGIVDRAVPVRDVALLSHGEVIEVLIANRLSSPTPLVHVEDWAREWAVEEIFDLDAGSLNDDRIGRALDAVALALDGIVGSVGVKAISTFGLDVARLHWDMTSISLFGDYDDPVGGFIEPRYGHPKDRRPDLKQVQTGLAVSGDGGIPVFHRAYHGDDRNTPETRHGDRTSLCGPGVEAGSDVVLGNRARTPTRAPTALRREPSVPMGV